MTPDGRQTTKYNRLGVAEQRHAGTRVRTHFHYTLPGHHDTLSQYNTCQYDMSHDMTSQHDMSHDMTAQHDTSHDMMCPHDMTANDNITLHYGHEH